MIIGIGVGVPVVLLLLTGGVAIWWCKYRNTKKKISTMGDDFDDKSGN